MLLFFCQDTLKAKHLLEKERQQKIKEIEEEIKIKAATVGGNPQELLLRNRRREIFEKEKRYSHDYRDFKKVMFFLFSWTENLKRSKKRDRWNYVYSFTHYL